MEKKEKGIILGGYKQSLHRLTWGNTVVHRALVRSLSWRMRRNVAAASRRRFVEKTMDKETKTKTIKEFQLNEKDCGSSEVQIALLTGRIKEITEHLKVHAKDFSTKRGLVALVNQLRRLLAYLQREDYNRYAAIIKRLGLRH